LTAQSYDIQFDHISVEHGLSNFSISDIVQDQQGFLWFGTEDGLNKYDGYKFIVYKPEFADSNSLPASFVSRLYIDRSGNLWIVAGGKLCRYNAHSDYFELFTQILRNSDSLANKLITNIFEANNGVYWIGTASGLYSYELQSGNLTHHHDITADSLLINGINILAFYEDKKGDLWIGTSDDGIYRYDYEKKTFINYREDYQNLTGLSSNYISCITEDHQGLIWIGTNKGLNKYDRNSDTITRYGYNTNDSYKLTSDFIFDIYADNKGTIWIGTFHSGLFQFQPESNQLFLFISDAEKSYSLSQDRIQCIYEDRSGVMWFGTYRGGLNRYSRHQDAFIRYRISESVYSIFIDKHRNLLIGTNSSGLLRYDKYGNLIQQYRHDPRNPRSLSNNSVMAIYEDKSGELWIGTGDGLNLYDAQKDRFLRYRPEKIKPEQYGFEVKTIYEDKAGNIWVGTKGNGLCCFDRVKKTFTYFQNNPTNPQSISNDHVWAIHADINDDLWIGTFGGGINLFNMKNQTFKRYLNDPLDPYSLNNNAVYSLYIDPKGYIWAGTFGGGLVRYEPRSDRFIHYTDSNGLPDNFVKAILPDNDGNLWSSTDKGLSKLVLSENEQFDDQLIVFKNYTKRDGLVTNIFLSGAYFKSSDGMLFFGGEGGCVGFYPDSIIDHTYIPAVVITSFKVFDQRIPLLSTERSRYSVQLSHKQNFFSFEFVALDYTEPVKNRYTHKLEGLDLNWVESGKRRYASYTNVDPGEYVFHVRGSNSDGIWNETGASVEISITPPFWQTWWFRLVGMLVIGAVIFGIYKYRVNHLLAMEKLRTRLAADLHDEVAGNLSSIAMFGKIMQDETGSTESKQFGGSQLLERIISLSQKSVASIREIIWAIDPKLETMYDLFMRVLDHAVIACRAQNMVLKFDIPAKENLPSKNLSPERRKHLWLIFKEAIHNATIHSNCTELSIGVLYKIGVLYVHIQDNGCGFNYTHKSIRFAGKGLETMKSRTEQLGGSFEIRSDREKGTMITVVVKI
jgi:ligand-binding sensor domain-containing protein